VDVRPICPAPRELAVDRVEWGEEQITLGVRAVARVTACPRCGHRSRRVHSQYRRVLADLPWHGLRSASSSQRGASSVTAERARSASSPSGSLRLSDPERGAPSDLSPRNRLIALALGGAVGARLAARLGMRTSGDTLLRTERWGDQPGPAAVPRVIGVDDWAWRRGQTYGTIVVDLEARCVLDLRPDRRPATFAAWLRAHPTVELITRDRGGTYAEAAYLSAPQAIQIADRFHLVCNLTDALEQLLLRHRSVLHEAARASTPRPPEDGVPILRRRRYSGLPTNRPGPTRVEQRIADNRARRLARYTEVVELRRAELSVAAIARSVGLYRQTVTRWLRAGHFPERAPRRHGHRLPRLLDPFVALVLARYGEGYDNGAALYRELASLGYRGTAATVRRYLAHLRRRRPRAPTPPPPIAVRGGARHHGRPPGCFAKRMRPSPTRSERMSRRSRRAAPRSLGRAHSRMTSAPCSPRMTPRAFSRGSPQPLRASCERSPPACGATKTPSWPRSSSGGATGRSRGRSTGSS